MEYSEPYGNSKSAVYIQGAQGGITTQNSEFANCYLNEDSGFFHLSYTEYEDTHSRFHDNVGINGGVFHTEYETKITINGDITAALPNFQNNLAVKGGVFYLSDGTTLLV